jgi:hypothetical protein
MFTVKITVPNGCRLRQWQSWIDWVSAATGSKQIAIIRFQKSELTGKLT